LSLLAIVVFSGKVLVSGQATQQSVAKGHRGMRLMLGTACRAIAISLSFLPIGIFQVGRHTSEKVD
jgi:hypothetical protein